MALSKRERVFKTLELDGEPDIVPIFTFGFEDTGTSFQHFKNSGEQEKYFSWVNIKSSKKKYYISQQRFWNVDAFIMDPFGPHKMKMRNKPAPPEFPGCHINPLDGRIFKTVKQAETGLLYDWYVGGYFTTPEILHSYWDKYGKPTELINDRINYSSQLWEEFVEALAPYFYPIVILPVDPATFLYGGITFAKLAYYIRKKPQFIHEVMEEYSKVNVEIIKRLAEAGVDVVIMGDDLGYKENAFFSLKDFREFILPYHKRIYQEAKKHGIIFILHSDGKIDEYIPDLIDAGINALQALEASAGVNLAELKKNFGDKLCFLGGLDSSGDLIYGTPQKVEENVKESLKAAGIGGGYFIGPSHDILNMPWENIMAMRAAIEKYRKYPLNF